MKENVEGRIYDLLEMSFMMTASLVPILGMLMLPKTICYILMIVSFLKSQDSK